MRRAEEAVGAVLQREHDHLLAGEWNAGQDLARPRADEPLFVGSIKLTRRQRHADEEELAPLAKISYDEAETAALAYLPGGTILEVELEGEDGYLVYGVDVLDAAGTPWDVKVDAGTGQVVYAELDDPPGVEDDDED